MRKTVEDCAEENFWSWEEQMKADIQVAEELLE